MVQFTDMSTGFPPGSTYAWNFGNGSTSILQNPSITYLNSGSYTVTLTVTTGSTTNTKTLTNFITVYSAPTVTYSGSPLNGCPPLNVQFSSQSVGNAPGAISSLWNFGDGNTS